MAAIDDEHSSPRKLPSIRRALLWLGIACTVPPSWSSAAAYEDYLLRKERVYETAVNMARTLVAELERELRGVESGLRILATSEELHRASWAPSTAGCRMRCNCRMSMVTCYWTTTTCWWPTAARPSQPRSEASCRTRSGRPDRRRASSRTCSTPPCAASRPSPSGFR